MRWLISLAFIGLATLVVSQTPDVAVRRMRPSRNLSPSVISLAVRRMRVDRNLSPLVAPVAVPEASILPYVGPSQYWGGFGGPSSWYGWDRSAPLPYWHPRRRSWGGAMGGAMAGAPLWRRRLVKPAKPIPVAPDAEAEPKPDTDEAVKVAIDGGVDAEVAAAPEVVAAVLPEEAIDVVPEVDASVAAPEVVAAVMPEVEAAVVPEVEAAVVPAVVDIA